MEAIVKGTDIIVKDNGMDLNILAAYTQDGTKYVRLSGNKVVRLVEIKNNVLIFTKYHKSFQKLSDKVEK